MPLPPETNLLRLSKHKINGCHEAEEGSDVVPVEGFALETKGHDDGEYYQGDDFLQNLQLNQGEGAAVVQKADAIGGHLTHVFKQGDAPREEDDGYEGPVATDTRFLQLQVAVPGKGHKDVGQDKQENGG